MLLLSSLKKFSFKPSNSDFLEFLYICSTFIGSFSALFFSVFCFLDNKCIIPMILLFYFKIMLQEQQQSRQRVELLQRAMRNNNKQIVGKTFLHVYLRCCEAEE